MDIGVIMKFFKIGGLKMDIHGKCAELYRDYRNNFLTFECFASWYGLPESLAREILKHGEFVHENQVKALKKG